MQNEPNAKFKGFEAVWKRVEKSRGTVPDGIKLMPRKTAASAAVRFTRPHKK